MATGLALPDGYAPTNLHLAPSVRARYVDSDMFDICRRLAQLDRRLYVVELTDPKSQRANYVIMEHGLDGTAYMVLKTWELDARVIEKCERMLRIPLDQRFAEAEREEREAEEAIRQEAIDETYEKVGHAFRRQLWKDGFIEHREMSYPTRGVAQPQKHR
jgi:hypothetical protein